MTALILLSKPIMKLLVVILTALCLAIPTEACAWIMGTSKDGQRVRTSPRHLVIKFRESAQTDLRIEGTRMETRLRNAPEFAQRNDYAVALMYLGRSSDAVELLEKLETERPATYEIAANLGTAYELSGNNQRALHWIKEGITRNEDSHFGTEWLHVKILEAKLRQEKDSDYFKNHSVLNLDLSSIKAVNRHDTITMDGEAWPIEEITRAIDYQLIERLKFVKGKDPSVGSLLFDYAALEAASQTLESASALLKMAMEYGYPSERITPLLAKYAWTIRFGFIREYSLIGGISLLLIAFLFLRWKQSRAQRAS
jgi:hypothetical protein